MRLNRIVGWSGTLLLVSLSACQPDSAPTSPSESPTNLTAKQASKQSATYLISFGAAAPSDLAARIQRAGGKVKKISRDAGIASAVSDAPGFAQQVRAIPGVEGVGRDRVIRWVDPNLRVRKGPSAKGASRIGGASIGDNETFFGLQWAPKAIHAPEAWDAGARGTGVRVAILDGGLNNTHIDLNGSVDVACSASMVDGFDFNQDVPGFSHATHVAGIVAARDNSIGTIGVAPGATLIGVKVLQAESGSFEDVIDGILYAANPGNTPGKEGCRRADVINMSLGATFIPTPEDKELLKALDRATTYADKQGVVLIAAADNRAINLDQERRVVTVPAMSARVIAISATGPVGFALGATNFSRLASYTNFGKAIVEFAAPGGDVCVVAGFARPCFVFDFVFSPGTLAPDNTGYFFATGTSMATAAATGVAALIIERHGGSLKPAQVEAALLQSADDFGKPGNDVAYGHGFVNALRAVR